MQQASTSPSSERLAGWQGSAAEAPICNPRDLRYAPKTYPDVALAA